MSAPEWRHIWLRSHTTYNVAQAARKLGVSTATIHRWLQMGWLKGFQITRHAPWLIEITEEDVTRLRSDGDGAGFSLTDLARRLEISEDILLEKSLNGELRARRVQERRRSRWIVDGTPLSSEQRMQGELFEYD